MIRGVRKDYGPLRVIRDIDKGVAALGTLAAAGVRPARAADTIAMWHIVGAETEPGLKNIRRWNDTQV